MLCKRIIPCLDVKDGRVVKGTNFVRLVDAGDPVEAAKAYDMCGADELVFLDIEATNECRKTMCDIVRKTAAEVFIPITVGGGVRKMEDITELLNAGADKVSINSAAIKNPELIREASQKYGKQCIVIAVDAKRNTDKGNWEVYVNGGRVNTKIDALEWCIQAEQMGAGEILLTSIDRDGMKTGYDIDLTKAVCNSVNIPVIASGGAGNKKDFLDIFTISKCDAALAASLFHFGEIPIPDLKQYLFDRNIPIRIAEKEV